ncbi:putative zinc-finger of transcription factor IIIC complex-domain-containing protein, partial [Flagelloscypha sp. PMI_526]
DHRHDIPLPGIEYLAEQDTLVLTFHDGSFRVLENICSSPRWVVDGSPSLSTRVRTISLDGSNTWIWGHELHRPSEFMYKHEAQMNLKFVVADIGDELPLEQIYSGLQNILLSPQVWPKKPIAMLRTFFANIRRSQYFLELHPRILNLLNSPFEDPSCGIQINPVSAQPLTSGLRKEFRHCILRFLYGWPNLVTLRARLPVTDFLYNLSTDEILREACRKTGQFLFNSIGWMNLRIFIRLAKAVASLVTENDLPFVLRVLVQSGLPDAPPDIVSEGQALAEVIHGFTGLSWDAFMNSDSLKETCPACHGEVPFAHLSEATCVNGHQWRRCSITTFILCTSHLRTCIGCSRKAFLPLSAESEPIKEGEERKNWLPQVGKGWIVEELLEGVNRCLFCGNSFVAVV